jgi:hypothetical protein
MVERRKKTILYESRATKIRKYILGGAAIIAATFIFGQAFAVIDKKAAEPYIIKKVIRYHDSCDVKQGRINEAIMYEILRISSVQKVTTTRFVKSAADSIFKEDSARLQKVIGLYRR